MGISLQQHERGIDITLMTPDADLNLAKPLDDGLTVGPFRVRALQGHSNLWFAIACDDREIIAARIGHDRGAISSLRRFSKRDGVIGFEFVTSLGPMRVSLDCHTGERTLIHWSASITLNADTVIDYWPRDLHLLSNGRIHTAQRGLRNGTIFASSDHPRAFSFLYFQDFSSLTDYFEAAKRSPADSVGGHWPELGYAPPAGPDCMLPKAREIVVSDAYLVLANSVPETAAAAAPMFLDMLAEVYLRLERPEVAYHDWPTRADKALLDVSNSPLCNYERQGKRYLRPYVGDDAKPPESMVQLTLAANVGEYDRWRDATSILGTTLRSTVDSFYNAELQTVVRWLPGESFDSNQADDYMNHSAMDSWYLHHALFNVSRMANEGHEIARSLFEKSLPYMIRVAHRFDYRWPIFFDLESLDIIRAEAEPGKGGETDVAGLYALVMLHAHEMFGDKRYLDEAKAAAARLEGLGFELAYQLNTTGFAAEALMRLWKTTKLLHYLALSEVCMANLFDNMWMWQCAYGRARHYQTFFGLFPLRDAPYVAPYEELEAHAKFHEYLALGGDDVRPSLRLLIAEYEKHSLDRGWYFYPDALPADAVATEARNGQILPALSVPLEDLRDGFAESGQVGQEIYGAGMPFVYTSRHYMAVATSGLWLYCNYPAYDFCESDSTASWTVGGDARGSCELRVIPAHPNVAATAVCAQTQIGKVAVPLRGRLSPEGHAVFLVRGGQVVKIMFSQNDDASEASIVIGAMCTTGGER